jgi:peptidoglycan/xylan/chitin deacetylase (PgdA/CDA1 family)
MTRFHIVAALAIIYGAVALWNHNYVLLAAAAIALLFMMGLGVAIPKLKLFGPFVCAGDASRQGVALTFDDGPDPRSTPRLLEILRAANVKAAFFCIGKNVAAHPELAAQIVREGHLLGNHTYNHSNFTNFFPASRLRAELEQTQAVIKKNAGVVPVFYRPPVGLSNPVTFRVAHGLDMDVIGWTIRSLDTVIADSKKVVARITRQLEPGAIILLHDGNIPVDRVEATVKTLLDTLHTLGYEVIRLDEILK